MGWHSKSIQETLDNFNVDPKKGISPDEVENRKEKYGRNEIISKGKTSNWKLLLEQFNNPVILILIVAAVLTAIIGDTKDAIFIGVVIILNTTIGFFQERKAADALESLKKMTSPDSKVLRNGEARNIKTTEVVCGDILLIESGMSLPADARLIESHNLQVDESMLTGESFASEKNASADISKSTALGDRRNMIYSGTIVQKGRGKAVAVAVGNETEFGKISRDVAEAEETVSPLQKDMEKFSKWLSLSIMLAIVAIFIVGFLRGNDLLTMFLTSVGLAVSAIPEGLPVAVTITLSIGVYQMAKHNAVVRRLAAVETLGSTNVICTDKTGTLTKNEMTVTKVFSCDNVLEVSGSGYSSEGEVKNPESGNKITYKNSKPIKISALTGALCTETSIERQNGQYKISGDPTEAALMIMSDKLEFSKNNWDVSIDIPFESEYQLMAVKAWNNDENYILVKGAPEKVLERCNNMLNCEGEVVDLNKEEIQNQISKYSTGGLRILAMAYSEDVQDKALDIEELQGLTLVGFAGIEDAVRPEARDAVGECHDAGVRVIMITGDHIQTAKSVAKSVGIAPEKERPDGITGNELDDMNDDDLFGKVDDLDVYARVVPQHKFSIVKQLQKRDNVVAMTGDGVNDAPALKQADIGVAMGSGTDVAKDSSHMVLMDDNFATIVKAVRRGRVILHNLQHILLYILTTSFGGILTIAMSVALGYPLPVLPAQLLWINLVTDGTSTFPLAFEKEHGNVMAFPPRKKDSPLITREMIYRIALAGTLMMIGTLAVFIYYSGDVYNPTPEALEKARTMAFCTLAFFQIWNVQNSRSVDRSLFFKLPHEKTLDPQFAGKEKFENIGLMKNPTLLWVMLLVIGLQVAAVVFPFMNVILDTVWLNLNDWLVVISVSFSVVIVAEAAKAIIAFYKFRRAKKQLQNQ